MGDGRGFALRMVLASALLVSATAAFAAEGFFETLLEESIKEGIKEFAKGLLESDEQKNRPYPPDVLTPAALETCVVSAMDLDAVKGANEATQAALKAEHDTLDARQAALTAKQPDVDLTSQSAVDAFNAELDAVNAAIDAYNVKIGKAKEDVDAFNGRVDTYNATCLKQYYVDDMNEILARLNAK